MLVGSEPPGLKSARNMVISSGMGYHYTQNSLPKTLPIVFLTRMFNPNRALSNGSFVHFQVPDAYNLCGSINGAFQFY